MVLTIIYFLFLTVLSGCATTGGYERYGVYSERHDRIYEHRASFLEDGPISMAYAIAYWDVLQSEEKGEKAPEVYYIWLLNNSENNILIAPENLSLVTEKGETIPLSRLTDKTPEPLKAQETGPYDTIAGYGVFEVPSTTIESDRPSRLVYDDQAGSRAVRYLQVEDMKKEEGLSLQEPVYYYAPVYPRRYWYPYYYPYDYYPYDFHFYYFYSYPSHHRRYYYSPVEPRKREFYAPPSPRDREFKRSSGFFGGLMDDWFGGESTKEPAKKPKQKPRREF